MYVKVLDHESKWQTLKYFNGNAYPSDVRSMVNSCWRRFSLIFSYYENMQTIKIKDTQKFLDWLNENVSEIKTKNRDLSLELSYESVGYISNLYMTLLMIKSFLDIWTQVSAILIDPTAKKRGFNKGKINGKELAGGRFINWLSRSVPQSIDIKNLISLISNNSRAWITNVVKYRDDILHYGEINNIKPLRLILKNEPKDKYIETDLLHASMPDGTSVLEYSRDKIVRLNGFIIEFIKLLPNINHRFLSLEPLII